MSSVIYPFRRLQCLHLHFKDFNVFSHLCFQKTTMSSFTFKRLQCLQPFTLSKDYNAFIYISNTSMSSVIYNFKDYNIFIYISKASMSSIIYTFKDCNVFIYVSKTSMSSVIYAFKDYNVFIYIYKTSMTFVFYILQDFNVFCLLHFIRLQRLMSIIGLNVVVFVLLRTQHPLFLCFEKKLLQISSTLQDFNVLHVTFYKTWMSSCFSISLNLFFTSCPVK